MPDWLASRLSIAGLVAVLLQQTPGIVWALHPPKVDPFARNSGSLVVEILEKVFGVATVCLIVIVPARSSLLAGVATASMWAALIVLAMYYALYVAYYLGFTALPILLGMAACPPAAFFLIAMSQANYAALATSIVFSAVHIGLTYANFGRVDTPTARNAACR